jgi:hypothetical protein
MRVLSYCRDRLIRKPAEPIFGTSEPYNTKRSMSSCFNLALCVLAAVCLPWSATAHFNCGTRDPSPFEQRLDQVRINHFKQSTEGRRLITDSCEELCVQCVEIDVYFHLSAVPAPSADDSDRFFFPHPLESVDRFAESDTTLTIEDFASLQGIYSLIDDNMRVLNERYAESPFTFTWRNSDPASASVSVNTDLVDFVVDTMFDENGVASELHTGDASVLNVYLTYRQCAISNQLDPDTGEPLLSCGLLGIAVFPSFQQSNRNADGVYVNYSTLTGGGYVCQRVCNFALLRAE